MAKLPFSEKGRRKVYASCENPPPETRQLGVDVVLCDKCPQVGKFSHVGNSNARILVWSFHSMVERGKD